MKIRENKNKLVKTKTCGYENKKGRKRFYLLLNSELTGG